VQGLFSTKQKLMAEAATLIQP